MSIEYVKLAEAARKLGVHIDTLRYWTKLLGIEGVKNGNIRYIPADCLEKLQAIKEMVSQGTQTCEAIRKVNETPQSLALVPVPQNHPSETTARLEGMEKAILTLVEKISGLVDENQKLRKEVSFVRGLLIPEKKTVPVIPWKPEIPRDPFEGLGFFERIWVQVLEPQKMRQFDS
jgi:DNA-binding transcriptional MerR regulator